MAANTFLNPFKPGAGHMPPYLAGRHAETEEFKKLLKQQVILENMVLSGLRGVGKTVLLERFKSLAVEGGWRWVGTDLSESSSTTEETIALRIITDLSMVTSNIVIKKERLKSIGFIDRAKFIQQVLNYQVLIRIFQSIPGLVSDRLKGVLELVWACIEPQHVPGIVFAYDEAQTLSDHREKDQYPLALLLDVFQSIQRKNIPFMLILTGLPILFPKLVEARTFAERMFRVVFLDRLSKEESREAILKPITQANCPIKFSNQAIDEIMELSGGYPYFIQFICKEAYDFLLQNIASENFSLSSPLQAIIEKLDRDFFSARWAKATDQQRKLLTIIAQLHNAHREFTVQEIVEASSKHVDRAFSSSHVNQMLSNLSNRGLIYKNRHGKYSFAVPQFGEFIRRQHA